MDDLTIKSYELRRDIVELCFRSKAGHIGGDLSVIDILTVLYYKIMNVSPDKKDDKDRDRDRFILSKGHCADALYVVLSDKNYFNKNELVNTFSTYQSKYIGHPSRDVPGIEMNSGSLGHGLSLGVGMSLAAKMDERDYRTYVVLGDGEMAEGTNYEAMMSAAHYKLDNLCATVDVNGLQISGTTKDVMNIESLEEKFNSFGWNVINVTDGNNCEELQIAYEKAMNIKEKPTVILAHTVKGKGISFMENNLKWHHGVMNEDEYKIAVRELMEVLS